MSFFNELKRRNVIRVAIAYLVVAWLIIQVSDVMIDNIGAPEWLFKFILLVLAIGFPVAAIFAWAFEMTPEGLKRDYEVDRSKSITPQTGRKLDYTIIAVLTVALSYFIYEARFAGSATAPVASESSAQTGQTEQAGQGAQAGQTETTAESPVDAQAVTPSQNSVAVLPFVNMSGDADNEYFSDGLTETLLHMLAQIPNLQVAARTSSFAFKNKNEAIGTVAHALGVAHVLEGSVQKAAGQVRVTAQLIRADDGFHMWSQNYTRPLQDIFAIQDEIAADVAGALGASLLGDGPSPMHVVATENLGAYDSYLKGLQAEAIFSYASLEEAEKQFKRALLDDPDFTDARLALARNYILQSETGLISDDESAAQVTPLIERVLKTEPDNQVAKAYALLNDFRLNWRSQTQEQLRESIDELRGFLVYMPSDSYLRTWLAQRYSGLLDDKAQALNLLQAGLLIDPLDADIYQQMGAVYDEMKDFDNSVAAMKRAVEMNPDNPNAYYNLAEFEYKAGNLKGYFENIKIAIDLDPEDHELANDLADKFYQLELPEEGEKWYQRVLALSPASPHARFLTVARAYARNEPEVVIQVAEQNIRDKMENRNGVFLLTMWYYADAMMHQERSREAYDFLLSVSPDIADLDSFPSDPNDGIMQLFGVLLMFGFAEHDQVLAAWDSYTAMRNARGFDWLPEDSWLKTVDLWVHGDREGAIDQFVNIRMQEPVGANLWIHTDFFPALYQNLWEEPPVAARLAERNQEFLALREEIKTMLQGPNWQ